MQNYLLAQLLVLLAEFDVLAPQLLELCLELDGVDLNGRAEVLLEVLDGIVGLISLLVQTDKRTGEVIDHPSLLQVLPELLLLGFGGLRLTPGLPDSSSKYNLNSLLSKMSLSQIGIKSIIFIHKCQEAKPLPRRVLTSLQPRRASMCRRLSARVRLSPLG